MDTFKYACVWYDYKEAIVYRQYHFFDISRVNTATCFKQSWSSSEHPVGVYPFMILDGLKMVMIG
jgi:hypothetical protein